MRITFDPASNERGMVLNAWELLNSPHYIYRVQQAPGIFTYKILKPGNACLMECDNENVANLIYLFLNALEPEYEKQRRIE